MYYFKDKEMFNRVKDIEDTAIKTLEPYKELSRLFHKIQKDDRLYLHSKKVAELATMIGFAYNLDRKSLIELSAGAFLHDVGKIELDAAILYKKGIFTEDERSYAQTHASIGKVLLDGTGATERMIQIAECHHKKLDGTGYPGPVDIDDISLFAQIVTVADMFEAMTADRCYREAMEEKQVFKILKKDRGINQLAVRLLEQNITTCRAKIYVYGELENIETDTTKMA